MKSITVNNQTALVVGFGALVGNVYLSIKDLKKGSTRKIVNNDDLLDAVIGFIDDGANAEQWGVFESYDDLLTHDDHRVRYLVAYNGKSLNVLAYDDNDEVREAVVNYLYLNQYEDISEPTAKDFRHLLLARMAKNCLVDDKNALVGCAIAKFADTELHKLLKTHSNELVRADVATHTESVEVLEELSKDDSALVRWGVAQNRMTPKYILSALVKDDDLIVSQTAKNL